MMISENPPVYAAFMMEGLRDYCDTQHGRSGYTQLLEHWGNGCWELVAELCAHAKYFDEAVAPYIDDDVGFPGVFEYEVCSPFGIWFAEYVMKHGYVPIVSEAKAEIDRLVLDFFTQ